MIRRLKIKQFQIHRQKELEFTNGVNVIIGETNQGKSAIIRALYLLLENQPRAAEKIFHRKGAKLPLEIELEDIHGNIIKRKKKKYSLNGVEYKAFNNEVPAPIRELFPLKEINWHKQLDPHFLILSTPGAAAKVLSASTGLEEQEVIVKEIKNRLSECKSEIKRLTINNQEAKDKMKQLRPIVKFMMRAKSIKEKEKKLNKAQEDKSSLEALLATLVVCEKKIKVADVGKHLSNISKILALLAGLEKKEEQVQLLVDMLQKVEDDGHIAEEKLNSYIKTINDILNQLETLTENEVSFTSLQKILVELKTTDKEQKDKSSKLKEKEEEFKSLLNKLKICPYCESSIKG